MIRAMAKKINEPAGEPAWKKLYPDHTDSHEPDIHISSDGATIFHSCRACDYIKLIHK